MGKQLSISPTEVVPSVIVDLTASGIQRSSGSCLKIWNAGRLSNVCGGAVPETSTELVAGDGPLLPSCCFSGGPPLSVLQIPERWVVATPGPTKDPHFETRLIGLAMLIGVLAAALANPRVVRGVPKAFFEGAGYAFTEVVSLIVTASCFGKAVELVGIAKLIGDGIEHVPGLLLPVAGFVPLAFASLSGSGMASTQSLYSFFVEPARTLGVDPKAIGAVVSIGAAAGRTMSPVAAVALMSAKLTGRTRQLAARSRRPSSQPGAVILL